jgi:serine/threonine-protein kinase
VRQLGKYLLIEPIASGGMAEVWRAEVAGPAGFVKQVAVKLVRADRGDDDEMVRMFIQEAQMASALHHAGIVHVFGLDLIEGRYAIAMELVHGKSLRAVLDRCREMNVRFGLPRAVHVAHEVARALAYAHRPVAEGGAAGLVHRDVSPHNVLVSFEGEVKLTDFGIARAPGAGGLTGPGTLKGKIGYMAPEQARSAPVDARADLFALGVVLWELCTGQRLFARDSEVATLRVLVGDERISPPSFWNESVPPELDRVVMGALERDPERRIASAEEMAERLAQVELALSRTPEERDLRPLMRRLWPGEGAFRPTPTPAPPPAPPARQDPGPVAAPAPPRTDESTVTWPRRAGLRPTVLVALALLVSGMAVAGWWIGRGLGPDRVARPGVATLAASSTPAASAAAPGPGATGVAPEPAPSAIAAGAPAAVPAAISAVPPPAASAPPPAPAGEGSANPPPARSVTRGVAARPAAAPARSTVLASAEALEGLELPPASSGEGILFVNATPWAEIHLDGRPVGYTPREMRLAAGRHRLKLVHPSRGSVERVAEVRAGERLRVETALAP